MLEEKQAEAEAEAEAGEASKEARLISSKSFISTDCLPGSNTQEATFRCGDLLLRINVETCSVAVANFLMTIVSLFIASLFIIHYTLILYLKF